MTGFLSQLVDGHTEHLLGLYPTFELAAARCHEAHARYLAYRLANPDECTHAATIDAIGPDSYNVSCDTNEYNNTRVVTFLGGVPRASQEITKNPEIWSD